MTKLDARIEPVEGGARYVVVPADAAAKAKLEYRLAMLKRDR